MSVGKDERAYHMQLILTMRPYLLSTMKIKFGDQCAICGKCQHFYEIDHKRYAPDITINDLQLLCLECHSTKTSVSHEAFMDKSPHCNSCLCFG